MIWTKKLNTTATHVVLWHWHTLTTATSARICCQYCCIDKLWDEWSAEAQVNTFFWVCLRGKRGKKVKIHIVQILKRWRPLKKKRRDPPWTKGHLTPTLLDGNRKLKKNKRTSGVCAIFEARDLFVWPREMVNLSSNAGRRHQRSSQTGGGTSRQETPEFREFTEEWRTFLHTARQTDRSLGRHHTERYLLTSISVRSLARTHAHTSHYPSRAECSYMHFM